ncbi:hypothetical protein NQ317_014256 [Molorchus minor]|uniref:Homocysteine-responsive endoplasmic reticulum-resident ubiquitin-like domain member 2 protein n=1 Tax=Molorchus minor TaxID=1323400 RepID=A0ABQ9JF54_9CUCU|nr:hypothetical protein NQ317_014256 [Molorchus minor]
METLPVTLIVKAPNQQIEDQTIKCELTWTIKKLKQHLSEVYPSRPLLNDSVTLKDILRQYEGQETHTVHLVCTSKYTKNYQEKQPVSHATSTTTIPNNIDIQADTQQQPQPNTTMGQGVPNLQPNMPWVYNTNGPPTADANQYAMQLAWMQQAYLQYMMQYMQLAANSYGNGTPIITTVPNNGEPVAQPQPNPADQPAAAPGPAPVPRDPENPDRDWLDFFYLITRVLVLFSVVYFYSSPIRFVFVLLLGFGLYLYQIGFFRNMNNNNNNNNGPADPVPQEEHAPSRLMIVWTFFATFFCFFNT